MDGEELKIALEWHQRRSNYIFLRDTLRSSIALDYNLQSPGLYTSLGYAEHQGKQGRDHDAIGLLVQALKDAVDSIAFHQECNAICAVPPSPTKDWDLPTELAGMVGGECGKTDVSSRVRFSKEKGSVKSLSLDEKWGALDAGALTVSADLTGARIVLIDDKYQSGTTAQFVASKLYAAGATEVHGLFCLKTWRDTDNT